MCKYKGFLRFILEFTYSEREQTHDCINMKNVKVCVYVLYQGTYRVHGDEKLLRKVLKKNYWYNLALYRLIKVDIERSRN